jgi:hypothetical protein
VKRLRAAVLKHGRYSAIDREVEARVCEIYESFKQLAMTTRDPFWHQLYAGIANQPSDRKLVAATLKLVIAERLSARQYR